jgi:hypothetical protein
MPLSIVCVCVCVCVVLGFELRAYALSHSTHQLIFVIFNLFFFLR